MAHKFDHASVVTMFAEPDMTAARAFWGQTLGMREVYYDPDGQEAVYQAGSGTAFGLYQHAGGSKADHTQAVFQVDDVEATMGELRGKGVTFEDYDLPGLKTENGVATMSDGSKGAWFRDPGGNIVGVFTMSHRIEAVLRGEAVGAR